MSISFAPRRRGFLYMDLIIAMLMATALLIAIALAIGKLHRGEQQLADARSDQRQLDAALLALQNGLPADAQVAFETLASPAPAGQTWVRATLKNDHGAARAALVGLVPADRLKGGAP